MVQLNQYETVLYFLQLSQNLTWDCLLISVYLTVLPVFAWCAHKIFLQIKTKQFYAHIMQKLVKTGRYTEINKQSHVKFWLNWIKCRTVSYSFSCNKNNWSLHFVIQVHWAYKSFLAQKFRILLQLNLNLFLITGNYLKRGLLNIPNYNIYKIENECRRIGKNECGGRNSNSCCTGSVMANCFFFKLSLRDINMQVRCF